MKTTKTNRKNFGLFWTLIKEIPGYKDQYKDVIKEGVVAQYTNGKTESLSEMFTKYPEDYRRMMTALKGDYYTKAARYDMERDKVAKRVIASICGYVDKVGYRFPDARAKVEYAKNIAVRAADEASFNKIPLSKLAAIYSMFCKKEAVSIDLPALMTKVGAN